MATIFSRKVSVPPFFFAVPHQCSNLRVRFHRLREGIQDPGFSFCFIDYSSLITLTSKAIIFLLVVVFPLYCNF